jgi:hypothetical protein
MNALWSYFWPVFALSIVAGLVAGMIAWRSRPALRWKRMAIGAAAMVAATMVWHGPLGGANRLAASVERIARDTLVHYEMPQVRARLQRGPVTRQLILSGQADSFQRQEIVRILSQIRGVSGASWSDGRSLPLIVEGAVVGLIAYLLGCLLAYVASVHRRLHGRW